MEFAVKSGRLAVFNRFGRYENGQTVQQFSFENRQDDNLRSHVTEAWYYVLTYQTRL